MKLSRDLQSTISYDVFFRTAVPNMHKQIMVKTKLYLFIDVVSL